MRSCFFSPVYSVICSLRQGEQLLHRQPLQFGDMNVAPLDLFVALVAGKRFGCRLIGGFVESGGILLEILRRVILGKTRSSQFGHGGIFLKGK